MWKSTFAKIAIVVGGPMVVVLLSACRDDDLSATPTAADTTHLQFINCKIENLQYSLQYMYCMNALVKAGQQHSAAGDSSTPGAVTDPGPGGMITDPNPGGMLTDPDPGGMLTDPDGGFIAFAPTPEQLEGCAFNNVVYKEAAEKCGVRLKACYVEGACSYALQ